MNALDFIVEFIKFTSDPITNTERNPDTGEPLYLGLAKKGTADSDALWFIIKFTYVGDSIIKTRISSPNVIWNNRATTVVYQ